MKSKQSDFQVIVHNSTYEIHQQLLLEPSNAKVNFDHSCKRWDYMECIVVERKHGAKARCDRLPSRFHEQQKTC